MTTWQRPVCLQCIAEDSDLFDSINTMTWCFVLGLSSILSFVFVTLVGWMSGISWLSWQAVAVNLSCLASSFAIVYVAAFLNRQLFIFFDSQEQIHVHTRHPLSDTFWGATGWTNWSYSPAHGRYRPLQVADGSNSVTGHVIKYHRALRVPGTPWNHRVFDMNGDNHGLRVSGRMNLMTVRDGNRNVIGQLNFFDALALINRFMGVHYDYFEYCKRCAKQRETLGVLIMAAVHDLRGSKARKPSAGMAYTRQLIEAGLIAARIDISMIDRWQDAAQKLHAELTVSSTPTEKTESATTA